MYLLFDRFKFVSNLSSMKTTCCKLSRTAKYCSNKCTAYIDWEISLDLCANITLLLRENVNSKATVNNWVISKSQDMD